MRYLNRLKTHQPKIRAAHWLLFFSLIGFGLRVQRLSFQPLWGDEGWSFYFAGQSLPQLMALTALDIHPPLYYMLLKGWLAVAGYGPETARFFSVIAGTALIPVVAVLGRRLLNGQVSVVAAGLVTVMPMAVYYSQEVRMYGLVTLLGALSTYFFIRLLDDHESAVRGRWGKAHILVTTAALYTMYWAAFIFLFQLGYVLLKNFARFSQRINFLPKLKSDPFRAFCWIGLLYLPWLIYAGLRTVNYVINKRSVENYLSLDFLRFFGDHLVAFSVGHLPADLEPYLWAVLPFVLVALVGFIVTLYQRQKSYLYLGLYLFIPLLAGYAINLVFPFNPPYFQRTWLIAAPAYWLFVAAGLVWLWNSQPLMTGALAVVMLLVIAVSLLGFYHVPRYPDEDYRPLLRDIAARVTADDTLLASYQWQMGFYYAYLPAPQPRIFAVPGWGEGWAGTAGAARRKQDLAQILKTSPRLWFPAHQALGHFWEDEAEADIARLGYPALWQWYGPQTRLALAGSARAPLTTGPAANFANSLSLIEASIGREKYEAGRGIVPVALTWRKNKNLGSDHRISLRLTDAGGRTWAIRDSQPVASQPAFTDLPPGETLTHHHGLLIPAGTPPGLYRLLLSVRRVTDAHPLDLLDTQNQPLGAELRLAELEIVDPSPPVKPAALPVENIIQTVFGQEARLVGYTLGSGPFKAGEALPLNLFWESLVAAPDPLTTVIQLQDIAGQPVFSYEKEPIRPTTQWQQGTLLRDPYDLPLPPTLPPGEYRLVVALLTPQQTRLAVGQGDQLTLAPVTTIDRPHVFDAPAPQIPLEVNFNHQAKLVGLDLPQPQVKAGDTLPLTLHWQALAPFDRSWSVFVHLLDSQGNIISQQDQVPGGGQFPTTGWLAGEYLVDSYHLFIPADTQPAQAAYHLEIGLYDVNDFSRLPIIGSGQNYFMLEDWPISVE